MGKKFRPGDDCAGCVVVKVDGRGIVLRCGCDATFGIPLFWAAAMESRGQKAACPGCAVPGRTICPSPLLDRPSSREIIRLRTEQGLSYREIVKATDTDHSTVHKVLSKAGLTDPNWRSRPRVKQQA